MDSQKRAGKKCVRHAAMETQLERAGLDRPTRTKIMLATKKLKSAEKLLGCEFTQSDFFYALQMATVFQKTQRLDMEEKQVCEFIRHHKVTCQFGRDFQKERIQADEECDMAVSQNVPPKHIPTQIPVKTLHNNLASASDSLTDSTSVAPSISLPQKPQTSVLPSVQV